jgi:hypothetical protein
MLNKSLLKKLYLKQQLSVKQIAVQLNYSTNKVVRSLEAHHIARRTISEAIYARRNPTGDPFKIHLPKNQVDRRLFDLAIGLYIGEGSKKAPGTVGLINGDPRVIRIFVQFMRRICGVEPTQLSAHLNLYDDVKLTDALRFWSNTTGVPRSQFDKPTLRHRSDSLIKLPHGIISLRFYNIKLHRLVLEWCDESLTRHDPPAGMV